MRLSGLPAAAVGIGLRQPHYAEVLQDLPALGFIEVHAENFFAPGGAALAVLQQAREHYPVSLHGVSLSLGSALGVDEAHLEQLARLVALVEPAHVSDHASFARAPLHPGAASVHANDLLPIAFTEASLQIMVRNVQRVQERLRRPILVENLSAYLHWKEADLAEPEFFNELTRRSGCGVLLDVNNLVVNALNAGQEPVASACAWLDALAPASVGEVHLAGYQDLGDIVMDDHGSRVHAPVWAVYAHARQRLGARPTLIEWDTALPALSVLLDEAAQAAAVPA